MNSLPGVTPLGLGQCQKCRADLCVSGRMVTCTNCGEPHPQHPLSVANRHPGGQADPPPRREASVRREDFPLSTGESLALLEKRVAALEAQLADPKKLLAPKRQQQVQQPCQATGAVA